MLNGGVIAVHYVDRANAIIREEMKGGGRRDPLVSVPTRFGEGGDRSNMHDYSDI